MATQILLDNSFQEQADGFVKRLAGSMTPDQARAYIARAYVEWETCPPDDFERYIIESLEQIVADDLAHQAGMLDGEPPTATLDRARALFCAGHRVPLDDGFCYRCENEAA